MSIDVNRTDTPSRAQEPLMVSGTFSRTVNGVEVESGYAYLAQRSTIFDQELVNWANRREAERKRAAAAIEQRLGDVADGERSARSGPPAVPSTGGAKQGSIPCGPARSSAPQAAGTARPGEVREPPPRSAAAAGKGV